MTQLSDIRLVFGGEPLDLQKMAPAHQASFRQNLSKLILKQGLQGSLLQLDFNRIQPVLSGNGGAVELGKSSELKRIGQIVQHYQNAGVLQREPLDKQAIVSVKNAVQKTVKAMNNDSIPGTNGQILAGIQIADSTLSLTRHILNAIFPFEEISPITNHLGYYAGGFSALFAARELYMGRADYKRAKLIGDVEGLQRAQVRLLSGTVVSTAALSYLAGRVAHTVGAVGASAAVMSFANAFFGAGSLLAMGASAFGAYRCYSFNQRLNEYLENPALEPVQKFQGALQFLKNQISVTPEEKLEMEALLEKSHAACTPEERKAELEKQILRLTEVKVKYMKRRTSHKSLFLILTKAEPILAKLANPEAKEQGIQEAAQLLQSIQMENKLKMRLYILGFVAAFLTLISFIVGTFFTAGTLPIILAGIAGALYLGMSVYSAGGKLLKKCSNEMALESPRAQNLDPIPDIPK